jgi:hypothetical protein
MKQLIEYIAQDYVYNIIDSDEVFVVNQEKLKLWYDLGFTRGLSNELTIVCTNALDATVRYLLNYNEETKINSSDIFLVSSCGSTYADTNSDFMLIVFPLVRRLCTLGVVIEPKQLQRLYNRLFPSIWIKYERMLESGAKIDAEAEATALLCDVITKRIKKNKKKKKIKA